MKIAHNENYNYSSIVLELLDGNVEHLKIRDGELTCCCPFHQDKKPSFAINLESGLYYCHACSAKGNIVQFVSNMMDISIKEAIQYLASKGHDVTDNIKYGYYTLEKYAEEKHLDVDFLSNVFNLRTSENGTSIEIPYLNQKGIQIAVRHRKHPNSENRFYWDNGSKSHLYGLNYLDKFPSEYVILVEGESDCHCSWPYEIWTIGVPGARNFKKDYTKLFDRFEKIYIHQEPDSGGKEFIKKICQCLPPEKLYTISAFDVDNECKDLADLHIKGKLNKESLLATAQKVPRIYLDEINQSEEISQHVQIAEKVLEQLFIKYYKGNFYIYNDGVYKEGLSEIERCMLSIDKNLKRSLRAEILDYLRIVEGIEVFEIDNSVINFKNGIYDINTDTLEAHNPDRFTLCQINAKYLTNVELTQLIQNGEHQYIDDFFTGISCKNSERTDALQEFIGYSMTYSVELQKCLFLLGETADNGKSTFNNLITTLIGNNNCCSISIAEFSERFCGSELLDKLLNVVHEVENIQIKDIAKLKTVISGDELSVEEKYKPRYKLKPFAHHIFAMNNLPELKNGGDEGYFRRLLLVPFKAKFTDEEKYNFNFDNLISETSLNYLANVSLRKYLKMKKEHKRNFANYKESNELIEMYKNEDNNALVFLNNIDNYKNLIDENNRIIKAELFKKYQYWCINIGLPALDSKSFYTSVLRSGLLQQGKLKNGYACFLYQDTNKI